MRQSFLYKALLIGIGLSLLGLYGNCSKVNVVDIPSTSMEVSTVVDLGNGEKQFEGTIRVGQKTHSDLDMIWVMDNSGSMAAEIAHVRANLDQFTTSIEALTSFKMALISQSGGGNLSFDLNVTDPARFLQLNQAVSSTNALFLAGSAICPDNSGSCASFMSTNVFGKLNSFLRPTSKKVFVVVTDDESQITPKSFTDAFNQSYPGQSFGIFGFIGLGADKSPCQAKTGTRYMELASQNGGQMFNICDRDWTSTFSTLASSVLSLIAPILPLPVPVDQMEILGVSLNGQPLDPSDYQISAAGLLVDLNLLQANKDYSILVRYRMK